ncbi:ATP-binding protein [Streptomyces sp. H27-C3]|uniref:sensor histidine kinase n=1 Tax=Streptomyces sp. H27-C3 TaxID=3046305 RepID=UPI0024BA9FB7|nr:ATP-binding protein [Streptomyces sp. H27-C3]MDJ0466214.1 ATP-binding protein [Streptomyces sp. H27-C3]
MIRGDRADRGPGEDSAAPLRCPRSRRRPWPRAGERLRLTALYAGLILLAGGGLIALVYILLRDSLYGSISDVVRQAPLSQKHDSATDPNSLACGITRRLDESGSDFAADLEQTALGRVLTVCLIALAVFAVLSVVLAWWMAGRVLRPVGVITEKARHLSEATLHERITLDAPPGELKRLADTFDEMLGRMEQLVGAQRRFAANAAHELRTPLALQRAAAEIGLAGEPDQEQVAYIRTELIGVAEHSQRLIDGLLLLATTERGLERREPVPIDELAATVKVTLAPDATESNVTLDLDAQPLEVEGDPVLLQRLIHNLVGNAICYNHPGGHVTLRTGPEGLSVSNTGPVIPAETVPLLFEPFHRLAERRQAPGEGVGLGLSIVAAIARVHAAKVRAEANPDGGLTVRVTFDKEFQRPTTGGR